MDELVIELAGVFNGSDQPTIQDARYGGIGGWLGDLFLGLNDERWLGLTGINLNESSWLSSKRSRGLPSR